VPGRPAGACPVATARQWTSREPAGACPVATARQWTSRARGVRPDRADMAAPGWTPRRPMSPPTDRRSAAPGLASTARARLMVTASSRLRMVVTRGTSASARASWTASTSTSRCVTLRPVIPAEAATARRCRRWSTTGPRSSAPRERPSPAGPEPAPPTARCAGRLADQERLASPAPRRLDRRSPLAPPVAARLQPARTRRFRRARRPAYSSLRSPASSRPSAFLRTWCAGRATLARCLRTPARGPTPAATDRRPEAITSASGPAMTRGW
jgi:hypothetical protein